MGQHSETLAASVLSQAHSGELLADGRVGGAVMNGLVKHGLTSFFQPAHCLIKKKNSCPHFTLETSLKNSGFSLLSKS